MIAERDHEVSQRCERERMRPIELAGCVDEETGTVAIYDRGDEDAWVAAEPRAAFTAEAMR